MPADVAPRALGRYELLAKLATGGMGEIFLARSRGEAGFEKLVVVKRLLPELVGSGRFLAMLLDEARIAARLSHPNVCEIYDLGQADGERFIVMQYLEGVPFSSFVEGARHDLPFFRLVAALAQQACEGLHHAHELAGADGRPLGLVHRDVSPSNLFVTTTGIVKVLDFGIAKAPGQSETTELGFVKGKVAFMSPEQVRGEPLDRRSDLFSLGAVLFELCTGQRAFRRPSDLLVAQAILGDPIPDVRELEPAAPAALSAVIARALSRDRRERWSTAREMGERVLEAAASFGGVPTPAAIGTFVRENFAAALEARRAQVQTASTPRAPLVGPPPRAPSGAGRKGRLVVAGLGFGLVALAAVVLVLAGGLGVGATPRGDAAPVSAPPARAPLVATAPEPRPSPVAAPEPSPPAPPPARKRESATTAREEPSGGQGWISIESTPYATVWVDGRRAGVTPLIRHPVSGGPHRVRAVLPDGREQRFPMQVRAGAEAPGVHLSW